MSDMAYEMLGLVLGILGILLIILANETDCWRCDAKDQFSSVGLSFRCRGLRSECLLDNMANIWTCDVPLSYLGDLPVEIVATRVMIGVSCGLGILAVLTLVFGMKCTKLISDERHQKGKLIWSSGALFLFGGMTGVGGLLWYGANTVLKYKEEVALGIPGVTYELGYSYWIEAGGAACLLASGTLLMVKCVTQKSEDLTRVRKLTTVRSNHTQTSERLQTTSNYKTYI